MKAHDVNHTIINQHAFRTVHIDGKGRRWLECQTCWLVIMTEHARRHVEEVHGAVEEEMPGDPRQLDFFDDKDPALLVNILGEKKAEEFDARVADRTYPAAHDSGSAFKQWLMAVAGDIRDELCDRVGTVSSPEVQREMIRRYPERTEGIEWRFLGGLWRGKCWVKTGEFREASHGRMAPVWRRA